MSAFGWGLALGAVVTSVTFPQRAFRDPAPPGFAIAVGGILSAFLFGQVFVPDGLEFPAIVAGIVFTTMPFWVIWRRAIATLDAEKAELDAQAKRLRQLDKEERERAAAEKTAWLSRQTGWTDRSEGRLLNVPERPSCVAMLGGEGRLFRLVEYRLGNSFDVLNDKTLPINKIISLDIARPTVKKTVYTTQAVPIVKKQHRSPVGRAAVGALVAGPLGAVVGAASGLGGKVTTEVEERKVAQQVEGLGDPQLIMGTSDAERPLLKIKFDPPELAESWLYKIRAAQARL